MKNGRIGIFRIGRKLIEDNEAIVRAIMSRVIVVRCEHMYALDVFEYMAISNDFDEVPQGEIVPKYQILIGEGEFISFVR